MSDPSTVTKLGSSVAGFWTYPSRFRAHALATSLCYLHRLADYMSVRGHQASKGARKRYWFSNLGHFVQLGQMWSQVGWILTSQCGQMALFLHLHSGTNNTSV